MSSKIGVLLSGCGVYDGSEIHEAVLTLHAIYSHGAEAVCMAPNIPQAVVIDHLTGKPVEGETRNVLREAARIARGDIRDAADVHASDFDALVLPGGFGAARNLCDYAAAGAADMKVQPDVARLLKETHNAGKPIGVICIAPVVMAAVAGRELGKKISLTIGTDETTAVDIESLGAEHVNCPVKEFVVDRANKIVSTPAYMLGSNPAEVGAGIEKLIKAVLDLA